MAYSESAERFAAAENLRGRSGGAGAVERAELPTPMATLMTAADAQRWPRVEGRRFQSTRRGRPRIVGRRVANAGGAGYSADWWTPTVFSGLVREELECLVDELLVELEDSAVAGVRVDQQLVVRRTSGHVEGVRRGQHPVVIAVGEEHGLADA
jgi:hypothetical protein